MVLLGDRRAEPGYPVDLLAEEHRERDEAGEEELRPLVALLDLLGLLGGEDGDQHSQRLSVEVAEGVAAHGCQEGRLRDAVLLHADDEQLHDLDVGPLVLHKSEHDSIELPAPLRRLGNEKGAHEGEERDYGFVLVAHLQRADQSWED